MATHFRETATIQFVADACASIAGALDSDPEAKHLARLWDSMTSKADELVLARRTTERSLARARGKLAVMDALWDPEIAAFGRDLVDHSGGKRDQAPYTRFFKNVNPSAVQDFGIDREVAHGNDFLAELGRDPNEALATKWMPRLGAVNQNLATAAASRRNALQAVALQGTAEELFIADVNRELDILEGDLLRLFPGQPKRVAAFLEATRPPTRRARVESDSSADPS